MSNQEREELIRQVDEALDDVRPHLAVDGGDVEVVDVTDQNVVKIKWLGACRSCSMTHMTMKAGLEQAIKSRLPQIEGIVAVNEVNV
jgi:Fe-S cluster biogenesis protein NfuA